MSIAIGLLLIAVVFLVWKLNDILGTQQGHVQEFKPDAPAAPSNDAPALNDDRSAVAPESRHQKLSDDNIAADKDADADAILSAVSDIAAADRYFDPEGFLVGAKSAFDMIMSAFAEGNRDTLSSLVSKEIYSAFEGAIQAREDQGQQLTFTIFEEPKVQYESADLDRGMAYVGVRIESLQTSVVTNSDGETVSGSQDKPQRVINHWVFSRQTTADDPNWTLIQTAA